MPDTGLSRKHDNPMAQLTTPQSRRRGTPALANPFPAGLRTVGIIAPARPSDSVLLARGCQRLQAWGLNVVVAGNTSQAARYFAGDDTARADALHDLLRSPQVDVLLALRGGYGCARLLPLLDWKLIRRAAKPLIGYSDITVLHLAWLRAGLDLGLAGPMLAPDFARLPGADVAMRFSLASLADAWHRHTRVRLPPQTQLRTLKPGRASGPLVPVTLSVLTTLLGTPWMPDLRGHILLLEDIHEAAYKIDRYLTQLRQAGVLGAIAGLVWGNLSGGEDAEYLPEILTEFAALVPGPVICGLPFGHCWPMVTVPVGRPGRVVATRTTCRLAW